MKVLFLDWHEPNTEKEHGITGFSRILSDFGMNLVRYPSNEWEKFSSVEIFATQFKRDIEDSSLIVSTGSFYWLKYFQDHFGVLDSLKAAISAGTPFVLQSVRGWENFFASKTQQDSNIAIISLFKKIGVQPTETKVFSDDASTTIGGGACAYFRAGDNCFLNADILGSCSELSINQPNILSFDHGVFPVVETGTLHYLVNSGDYFTNLEIGSRPAVFVEVRNGNMKGYVIGGNLLRDGYDAMAGYVPGIELNEGAVRSLIEKIVSWKKKPQTAESKSYQDLFDLERGLGSIIRARVPLQEAVLLKDAELRHIIEKVRDNWSLFSDLFSYKNVAEFSLAMSSIPAGARRFLSHPIRLVFEPDALHENLVLRLSNAAAEVRKAQKKLEYCCSGAELIELRDLKENWPERSLQAGGVGRSRKRNL